MTLPRADTVVADGGRAADDGITLDYEGRFLRRRRLLSDGGAAFLLDLAKTTDLKPGDAIRLEDGRLIAVHAASEPVLRVRGRVLARLAWHIGNRHTPCQIGSDHLVIRDDPVLADMLKGLGAEITRDSAPFQPERGAYGQGRTMGHSHDHG